MYVDVYLRVSSKTQGSSFSESSSLQTQLDNCKKYANDNNMIIDNVYQDIGSGINFKNRPQFKRMVRNLYCKNILVSDISRFHRNVAEGLFQLEKLTRRKVTVISINDDLRYGPNSNFNEKARFRRLLGYAEDEWIKISNRINISIKFRQARGDYIGNPPYGYMTERNKENILKLKINKSEQKVVKYIQKHINQNFTYKQIANILNKKKIKKRGKEWKTNMICYIVKKHKMNKLNCKKLLKELDSISKSKKVKRKKKTSSNYNLRKRSKSPYSLRSETTLEI